jgi:hypothetical protein
MFCAFGVIPILALALLCLFSATYRLPISMNRRKCFVSHTCAPPCAKSFISHTYENTPRGRVRVYFSDGSDRRMRMSRRFVPVGPVIMASSRALKKL